MIVHSRMSDGLRTVQNTKFGRDARPENSCHIHLKISGLPDIERSQPASIQCLVELSLSEAAHYIREHVEAGDDVLITRVLMLVV